jgi:hypothetical protein
VTDDGGRYRTGVNFEEWAMKGNDVQRKILAALAAVRDCAEQMENSADGLLHALPTMPMDEILRASSLETSTGLKDTAGRVTFEVALLQAQLGEGKMNVPDVIKALSSLDATLMGALASAADVVDELEVAAERDERNEPPFVMLIEATGVMLQGLERAKVATEELRAAC